jgi:hypothetical protein
MADVYPGTLHRQGAPNARHEAFKRGSQAQAPQGRFYGSKGVGFVTT